MGENERRRHRRVGFKRMVDITYENGISDQCVARDFSMMGLGFESATQHRIGEKMQVRLKVAPRGTPVELQLNAEVKYTEEDNGHYFTGIQFHKRSSALGSK